MTIRTAVPTAKRFNDFSLAEDSEQCSEVVGKGRACVDLRTCDAKSPDGGRVGSIGCVSDCVIGLDDGFVIGAVGLGFCCVTGFVRGLGDFWEGWPHDCDV